MRKNTSKFESNDFICSVLAWARNKLISIVFKKPDIEHLSRKPFNISMENKPPSTYVSCFYSWNGNTNGIAELAITMSVFSLTVFNSFKSNNSNVNLLRFDAPTKVGILFLRVVLDSSSIIVFSIKSLSGAESKNDLNYNKLLKSKL